MISRNSTGTALRLTSLAAAVALALFITISFLCAAAFVYVLQTYGLIAGLPDRRRHLPGRHADRGRLLHRRARIGARGARGGGREIRAFTPRLPIRCWSPPASRSIRAIGVKKLIPILAVGGLALGFLASRGQSSDEAPAE